MLRVLLPETKPNYTISRLKENRVKEDYYEPNLHNNVFLLKLDLRGRKWWEAGDYIMRSFICTLHQIL
jgi:hypothetical protein